MQNSIIIKSGPEVDCRQGALQAHRHDISCLGRSASRQLDQAVYLHASQAKVGRPQQASFSQFGGRAARLWILVRVQQSSSTLSLIRSRINRICPYHQTVSELMVCDLTHNSAQCVIWILQGSGQKWVGVVGRSADVCESKRVKQSVI